VKAIVCDRYGPPEVLRLDDVPWPVPARTAAVQLSRYFGADVTAVCGSKNLGLVGSLGADHVIDNTREDFTANGQTYDVIFDAVGKHSFRRCRGSLNRGGIYLATDDLRNLLLAQWTRFGTGSTGPSSTSATRWRTWLRPAGTSIPGRRQGTWS
jgi:NADPH:quinone reductase-like Zn-dependent oxidoreductase